MGSVARPAVSGVYFRARSEILELQCYLQNNERTIPFGPTLIKHATRAYQVLPKNEMPDETELVIARDHLKSIRTMLEEAREVIPAELLQRCDKILQLLDNEL